MNLTVDFAWPQQQEIKNFSNDESESYNCWYQLVYFLTSICYSFHDRKSDFNFKIIHLNFLLLQLIQIAIHCSCSDSEVTIMCHELLLHAPKIPKTK